MGQSDPLTCLLLALAHYTGLPADGELVRRMGQVVAGMAPYLAEALQPGHRRLYLELENGRLRRVEPGQSYLIRDDAPGA